MPKFTPAMRELTRFMEICLPDVAQKLKQHSITASVFASQWFITLFSYSIPFDMVARIWDLFFLKKWSVIFRMSIVLLELVRPELVAAKDLEATLHVLKLIPEKIREESDLGKIVERAMRLNLDEDDARVLGNVHPHLDDPNDEDGTLNDKLDEDSILDD